jgi:hypothetical protein
VNISDLDDRLKDAIAQAVARFNVPGVRKAVGNQDIYRKANGDVQASFEYFSELGRTRSILSGHSI